MADTKVPEAPVSSTENLVGELDTMGKQIETLSEDPLKKETGEQLKGLRAAIADPTADPKYLRMQIDHLRSGIDAAKKIQQGKEQIRDILSELSPERIESSAQLLEILINIYPEGEGKTLLRGYAGSFMLEQFEKNNHRITIGADNTISLSLIDESKKTPEITQNKINLEKKINTLIGSKKMDINTLRTGMLYRAPSFTSYSDTLRDQKGQVPDTVKNRDPKAYFEYLSEKKKHGYVLSEAEKTLVQSEAGFTGFTAMIPAISEAKDLSKMQQVAIIAMKKYENPQSSQSGFPSPQSGNRAPSVVGEGIGTVGAGIGKIAGAGARGGIGIIADIFNSAVKEGGAWGGLAVLGGLIAAVWKLGFWKTLGGIFGIGVVSEAAAGRIDLDKEAGKLQAAGAAIGATADKATTAVSGQEAGVVKPGEEIKLSPSQEMATTKVNTDSRIKNLFNTTREKKSAKLDAYLNFINTTLKDKPLSTLVSPADKKQSIFSITSGFDSSITVPQDMDGSILKDILRIYLTGVSIPASSLVQDKYKPMIAGIENKYDPQKDTLIGAIQKVYNISDSDLSKNIETKIAGYNYFMFNGKTVLKDNTTIEMIKGDKGYTTKMTIKDPTKLNTTPSFTSINPLTIEFDANGKLITKTVQLSGLAGQMQVKKDYVIIQNNDTITFQPV